MQNYRAGLAALVTGIVATAVLYLPPAFADRPTEVSFEPAIFVDVDPCTGDLHEITIFIDAFLHLGHPNNFVGRAVRTGFTDSGYELFSGNEVRIDNGNVFISRFKDMWRADDGRMFEASGRFTLNIVQNEVKVDDFVFRCIGADTVLSP